MKNLLSSKLQAVKHFRKKLLTIAAMILLFIGAFSCQKEKEVGQKEIVLENRSSTFETILIDKTSLVIDGCCAKVRVYTDVLNLDPPYPIHTVYITKGDGSLIGQHFHGGGYGGQWYTDPSKPMTPYFWIMEFCFDGTGVYCFEVQLIGINGPGLPGNSTYDPNDPHKICFNIERCENDPDPEECVQYICWEMLAGCCDMDIVESITLADCAGNPTTYPIGPHTVGGNYNDIVADILAVLNSQNWGGTFQSYHPCKTCQKGGDPNSQVPGFFFINSSLRIISINGQKDCATPPDPPNWIPESKPVNDGCPEAPEGCFVWC
jgi:hypothetical protein